MHKVIACALVTLCNFGGDLSDLKAGDYIDHYPSHLIKTWPLMILSVQQTEKVK